MSNTSDRITRQLGENIQQSIGGDGVADQAAAAQKIPLATPANPPEKMKGRTRNVHAGEIDIQLVERDPDQPRKTFDPEELRSLAKSLKTEGQLQPILVWWNEKVGKWVILDGERRWRAAQMAGLPKIKAEFLDKDLSENDIRTRQLIANLLREDLDDIELAKACRERMQANGWNAKQLATALHLSNAKISRILPLLNLSEDIQQKIKDGKIGSSVGYEISRLEDPEAQRKLAEEVERDKLPRQEVSKRVQETKGKRNYNKKQPAKRIRLEVPGGSVTIEPENDVSYDTIDAMVGWLKKGINKAQKKVPIDNLVSFIYNEKVTEETTAKAAAKPTTKPDQSR